VESIEQPMQEPGGRREKAGEPKLLRTPINDDDGSPPSQSDVEKALESAVARLMSLEARQRAQASRDSGTRPSEERGEDHDLVEEIRALKEAVAELRACTNPEGSAPLAQGFVLPANPEQDAE
jgi:hypothetical protein